MILPMSLYRKLLLRLYPYKSLSDDYITRLQGSIGGAGMLHPGNVYALDYAIRHAPSEGAMLEIGSFAGLSTNVITWLLRKTQRLSTPFFCCDPWVYDGFNDKVKRDDAVYMTHFEGCEHVTRAEYTRFIRESFVRNMQLFSQDALPKALHTDSDTFFEAWKKKEIHTDVFGRQAQLGGAMSFAYIDGDHSYDQARRDVENTLEYLLPGGYLLLDDSADYWKYGSVQLAKEMRRWKGLNLVMKNPNYLYIKH